MIDILILAGYSAVTIGIGYTAGHSFAMLHRRTTVNRLISENSRLQQMLDARPRRP